jgi:hypothetical protein
MAKAGVALRKFGQQIIEGLAKERVHPSWIVPGGVNAPLAPAVRDRILAGLPAARALADKTLAFFKKREAVSQVQLGHCLPSKTANDRARPKGPSKKPRASAPRPLPPRWEATANVPRPQTTHRSKRKISIDPNRNITQRRPGR